MLKPGGFLKKVFNPGNVVGKAGKAIGKTAGMAHKATMGSIKAPAKAMGGIFGKKGPSSGSGKSKSGGGLFGGARGLAKKAGGSVGKGTAPAPAME